MKDYYSLLFFFVNTIIFLFILFFFKNLLTNLFEMFNRFILFKRYAELRTILELNMDTTYNKLYQQECYVHTINRTPMNKDELEAVQLRFIKDTLHLCGDNIVEDLENCHGSLDCLITFLSIYFVTRFNKEETDILNNDENEEILKETSRVPFTNTSMKNALSYTKGNDTDYFL